jgi:hypothetical protein
MTPGAKVGAYEITGAIGASGMGKVYRARDSKLGRDLAGCAGRGNWLGTACALVDWVSIAGANFTCFTR